MMKKLFGAALAVCFSAGMVMGSFAGELTAEEVLQNYMEAGQSISSLCANASGVADISLSVPDAEMTMGITGDMNMDLAATMDPLAIAASGTASGELMGEGGSISMQMYMVPEEDGSMTMYAGVDQGEGMEWASTTMESETMDQIKQLMGNTEMMKDLPIAFELADGTVSVNDTECYALVSTMGIEDMITLYKAVAEKAGEALPADALPDDETMEMVSSLLGGLKLNIEIDVNAEDFTPVKARIDMDGSDWVTLGSVLASVMGLTNEDGSLMSVSLDVNDLYIEYLYDYTTEVAIEVPQEVIDQAVAAGSLEDLSAGAAEMVEEVESEF